MTKIKSMYRNHRRHWQHDTLTVSVRDEERGEYLQIQSDGGLLKMDLHNAEQLANLIIDYITNGSDEGGYKLLA